MIGKRIPRTGQASEIGATTDVSVKRRSALLLPSEPIDTMPRPFAYVAARTDWKSGDPPSLDDASWSRDTAFLEIRARIRSRELAAEVMESS